MADKASNVVLNFKMNGQVQYAQTLKQINMVMQTASKEYTSHITAMGKDASMTDKLVAEKKKLETQMTASAQKVAMLSEEFEQMQNDSNATADDLQKLYNQLLSAETAHAKLENAMKRVNEGLSEEATASREAKDELKNLAADAKQLQAEQQRLASSFELQKRALGESASESERAELALKQYEQQTTIAKKAIENLEKQLDATKRAFGENSVEVTQLETKLNQARTELSKIGDEFNEVEGGSEKATFSIENFAGKAAAVAALATAVAAVGTATFDVAKEFDQATAKIQMSLGVTAEEAKGLEDAARNIWKDGFGESLDDVTDALVRVKQNMHGLADDSNLEQITRDSMVLAQTFDSDVNEVVRAGYNLMENFGISSNEAFDMMAWGAQNGLNFSQELFDNLAEYSGLFANMGYSVEEYFGILQRGSEAGVYNLDYLNDSMKEFQIRIKDGSDATGTAFADMKQETQDVWDAFYYGEATVKEVADAVIKDLMSMEDQTYASMLGVTLFGTKWEDLESSAMYAMLGTQSAIESTTGKMQQMIEVQDKTFGQRWTELLRTGQEALLPLGEAILNVAEVVLPILILAINMLVDGFSSFASSTQDTFSSVKSVISEIVEVIASYLQEKLTTIKEFWSENGEQILQAVENAFNGIKAAIEFVMPFIKTLIEDTWNAIKNVIDGALDIILGIIKTFSSALTGDWNGVWEGIKQILSGVVEALWGILQLGLLGKIFKVVKKFGGDAFQVIKDMVDKMKGRFDDIVSAGKSKFDDLKNKIMTPVNAARDAVKAAVDKIKGFFNFNWSLPKLKVPKFSISPAGWKVGDLLKGEIPKLGVQWYAKGGIMTRPTAFGINGNNIMAGGEAGPEAILPLNDQTYGAMGRAIANAMPSGNQSVVVNVQPAPIYLDGKKFAEMTFHHTSNLQHNSMALKAFSKGVSL